MLPVSKLVRLLCLPVFMLGSLAVASVSQAQSIDYLSRHTGCVFLTEEFERIKQANADGIPGEGLYLTVIRAITFPMYLMESFVGYSAEPYSPNPIGGQANFSGSIQDVEFAMRRKNCLRPLQRLTEEKDAGELADMQPAPIGKRVRDEGFYYGLPFLD